MKPNLSNKKDILKYITSNNTVNIPINNTNNIIYFNFIIILLIIVFILFLIFRYLDKKKKITK